MKIFVTGVDGYIGTLLAPLLIERGHEVIGLDTGFYRQGWLYSDPANAGVSPQTFCKDLRHVQAADLAGPRNAAQKALIATKFLNWSARML